MPFRTRRLVIWLALLLLLLPALAGAQGGTGGFVQLTLNRDFTIPFFETFFDARERPYLHFNSLMRALELPITYEPSLGSAAGFLADGTTRFVMSLERRTVEVGKVTHRLAPDAFRVEGNRLFILWSEAQQWLPIHVEWSVEAYEVRINTDYRLPSVQRKLRDLERERLLRASEEYSQQDLYPRELPLFEPGMMELNTGISSDSEGLDKLTLSLTGVHMFLKGDLEYSVSRRQSNPGPDENQLDYVRLRYYDDLRRKELTLGDTFTTGSPLILPAATFRGASFFTGGRLLRFGRTAIIGTAAPGSEVDLYRLGVLIAFTRADSGGFYRFENVPLVQESNLFEVRIFTPQGRRYSEFKLVSSQEEMMSAGELASQGGVGKSVQEQNPFTVRTGEVRYGLFRDFTLGAYVMQLEDYRTETGDVVDTVDAVGLFGLLRPISWLNLLVEQAQDSAVSGSASRLGAFLVFQDAALELERHTYEGEFAPPARRRSTAFTGGALLLSLDQVVGRTRLLSFNTSLTLRTLDFGDSREGAEQELRLDRSITSNVFLNMSVFQARFTEEGEAVGGNRTVEATTTYRFDFLSRAELVVSNSAPVLGEPSTTVRATYQKIQQQDSRWAYQASYALISNTDDLIAGSLGYLFANNIRVGVQGDNTGAWGVSVDYAIPFRVSGEGVESFPPGTFGRAGLQGAVFMDENGDGVRQPEESTLSDVHILAPGIDNLYTDETGHYEGWGLPQGNPIGVEVDLLTTDALFAPLRPKYLFTPHPGELVTLDIPLVAAGGLTGVLSSGVRRSISPGNGVEMILETPDGTRVAAVQAEWDGTFIIEGIPPGKYVLYGNPEELAARGIQLRPERKEVEFPAGIEPAWLEELTFRIERRGGGPLPGAGPRRRPGQP